MAARERVHVAGWFALAIVAVVAIAGCGGGGSSADTRDAAIVAAIQQTTFVVDDVLALDAASMTFLEAVERAGGVNAVAVILRNDQPVGVQPPSDAVIWLVELTVEDGGTCETHAALVNANGRTFASGVREVECPPQAEIPERDLVLLASGSRLLSEAPAIQDVELLQTELGDAFDDIRANDVQPEPGTTNVESDATVVWVATFKAYIGPLAAPEEGAPAPECESHVRVLDEAISGILYQGKRDCD